MRARMLAKMQGCKQEIEDKAVRDRCVSRVEEMRVIIRKHQRTLLHPHDFCLSMEDVGQIPDIRRAIVNGTDEEFNRCIEDVTSGLPKLTSKIREERTTKYSILLPFDARPDNVLSLATAWFMCFPRLMDGTKVLGYRDPVPQSQTPWSPVGEETFNVHALAQRREAKESQVSFAETASTIARELILDCGEDPESVTFAEMDLKFHRFAIYENDKLVARNWRETVWV